MQSETKRLGKFFTNDDIPTPFQSQLHQGSRSCYRMDIALELFYNSRDSSHH